MTEPSVHAFRSPGSLYGRNVLLVAVLFALSLILLWPLLVRGGMRRFLVGVGESFLSGVAAFGGRISPVLLFMFVSIVLRGQRVQCFRDHNVRIPTDIVFHLVEFIFRSSRGHSAGNNKINPRRL